MTGARDFNRGGVVQLTRRRIGSKTPGRHRVMFTGILSVSARVEGGGGGISINAGDGEHLWTISLPPFATEAMSPVEREENALVLIHRGGPLKRIGGTADAGNDQGVADMGTVVDLTDKMMISRQGGRYRLTDHGEREARAIIRQRERKA